MAKPFCIFLGLDGEPGTSGQPGIGAATRQQTHTKVAQMQRPVAVENARPVYFYEKLVTSVNNKGHPDFLDTRENEGSVAKRVPKVG